MVKPFVSLDKSFLDVKTGTDKPIKWAFVESLKA